MNISLRCCLNKSYDDRVYRMHTEANVLPLDIRRNIALLKLMFNTENKESLMENLERSNIRTRSSSYKNFKVERPRCERYRKSMVYQGKKTMTGSSFIFEKLQ